MKTESNDLAADELLSMFIYAPPEEVLDWATYDWPPSASDDASSFGSTGEFAPGPGLEHPAGDFVSPYLLSVINSNRQAGVVKFKSSP